MLLCYVCVLNFVKLNDAAFDLSNGPVLDEVGTFTGYNSN